MEKAREKLNVCNCCLGSMYEREKERVRGVKGLDERERSAFFFLCIFLSLFLSVFLVLSPLSLSLSLFLFLYFLSFLPFSLPSFYSLSAFKYVYLDCYKL